MALRVEGSNRGGVPARASRLLMPDILPQSDSRGVLRTSGKIPASHVLPNMRRKSFGRRKVLLVLRPGDGFGYRSHADGPWRRV
jgi:hypothetical protein